MKKKDYELIAGVLNNSAPMRQSVFAHGAWRSAVYGLAEAFKLDNPKFDRAKFLELCGIKSEFRGYQGPAARI